MDIVIVICLVLVIALLISDKIFMKKANEGGQSQSVGQKRQSDIMGPAKEVKRHRMPLGTPKRQSEVTAKSDGTFGSEVHDRVLGGVAPQEEPDEVNNDDVDLSEEEQQWYESGMPNGDDGFAVGVTFEELSTLGKVLQQDSGDPVLGQKAAEVVLKIQGTELFGLLESSMANASQKIARLLDKQLVQKTDSGSSNLRSDFDGFNIEQFV